ncbi:MAG: hypothetical protein IPL46_02070 [Saprospiraceae bacterium]|nr:hypothetical protein [Saprospiraceae bacterium]
MKDIETRPPIILLMILVFTWMTLQCTKEEPFLPVLDIHPDFQPLVDLFEEEASKRGINLTVDNLILQYDTSLTQFICAECNSSESVNRVQKQILVNPNNRICWQYSQELEALIFHELGHCILRRSHLSDTLPNGDPKSLMIVGDVTVYAPCRYVFGQAEDCNNVFKRSYYIDELFDSKTPIPDWAK